MTKDQDTKRYRDLLKNLVSKGGKGGTAALLLERKGAQVGRGNLTIAEDADVCELLLGRSLDDVRGLPGAVRIAGSFAGRLRSAIRVPLTSLSFLNVTLPLRSRDSKINSFNTLP